MMARMKIDMSENRIMFTSFQHLIVLVVYFWLLTNMSNGLERRIMMAVK